MPGYTGALCDVCATTYARAGLAGSCTLCDTADDSKHRSALTTALRIACAVVLGAAVMGAIVAALWAVAASGKTVGGVHRVVTLAKIFLSSMHVMGQLGFALDLEWPGVFRWLAEEVKLLFSLNLLVEFLDVGCIAAHSFYHQWLFAFALMPGLTFVVLLASAVKARDISGLFRLSER